MNKRLRHSRACTSRRLTCPRESCTSKPASCPREPASMLPVLLARARAQLCLPIAGNGHLAKLYGLPGAREQACLIVAVLWLTVSPLTETVVLTLILAMVVGVVWRHLSTRFPVCCGYRLGYQRALGIPARCERCGVADWQAALCPHELASVLPSQSHVEDAGSPDGAQPHRTHARDTVRASLV